MVTSKTAVNTVKYEYDNEGRQTKKVITPANGTAQTIYYETSDDNTVVKFSADGRAVTSHSKSDSFGRKVFDELQLGTGFVSRQFSYYAGAVTAEHAENGKLKSSPTTQLVSQIVLSDGRTISYEYDAEERITSVIETYTVDDTPVTNTTTYTYDALGQLLTETVNGTVVNEMTYDNYGNILTKNNVAYTYGDATWKDLLTKYGNQTITYDAQGNPTSYLGHTLTWEKGRQLKSFDGNTYTYNANGIRTSKTVNGVKHTYTLDGTKILSETWDSNTLIPLYDNEESVCGIVYNDTPYYFIKNLQGDVIAIVDKDANTVAKYSYDAWGAITSAVTYTELTENVDIAAINPFRYRCYYYDEEIEMYYLQSRYYNAYIGRFVNADKAKYVAKSGTILGAELYAYCENNAVCRTDTLGTFWLTLIVASVALVYLGNNLVHSVYNQAKAPSGFIYDQNSGKVANLRFGFFKSSFNGCGWIATYNALILLGKKPKAEDIISEYELTGAVLCGVFGVQPYAVTHYFRFRGYKVETTYNPKKVDSVAKKHTCNILFYWHSSGAHYFATKWDGTQFVGYNVWGSTGPEYLGTSLSKKFHNNNKRKLGVLISISKK